MCHKIKIYHAMNVTVDEMWVIIITEYYLFLKMPNMPFIILQKEK